MKSAEHSMISGLVSLSCTTYHTLLIIYIKIWSDWWHYFANLGRLFEKRADKINFRNDLNTWIINRRFCEFLYSMRKLPPGDILASSKQLVLIVAPVLYFFFLSLFGQGFPPLRGPKKIVLAGRNWQSFYCQLISFYSRTSLTAVFPGTFIHYQNYFIRLFFLDIGIVDKRRRIRHGVGGGEGVLDSICNSSEKERRLYRCVELYRITMTWHQEVHVKEWEK